MKIPGMTMSPRPSMAKLLASSPFSNKSWGKTTGGERKPHVNTCSNISDRTNMKIKTPGLTQPAATGRSGDQQRLKITTFWETWALRQRLMLPPTITLSRNNRLRLVYSHLIGASKDLATVTMTLVPNTWREREEEHSRRMRYNYSAQVQCCVHVLLLYCWRPQTAKRWIKFKFFFMV